jgi:hypothetical protein
MSWRYSIALEVRRGDLIEVSRGVLETEPVWQFMGTVQTVKVNRKTVTLSYAVLGRERLPKDRAVRIARPNRH